MKCTKFPAGVKSVTNSVFALPYFQNNSWVYTLSAINLANKVADDTPTTQKEILDRTLKYTVTGTDVVEPDDSSKLEVVQGKDLLTLVTCTPYGVNSHRLLVHAERAPFEAATSDSAATVSQVTRTVPKSHQLQIIIAGLAVIAVVIVKIYFWRRKRRRFRQATEVTK